MRAVLILLTHTLELSIVEFLWERDQVGIGRRAIFVSLQLLIGAEELDRPLLEEDEGARAHADLSSEAAARAVNLAVVLPDVVETVVVRLAVDIRDARRCLSLVFHFRS